MPASRRCPQRCLGACPSSRTHPSSPPRAPTAAVTGRRMPEGTGHYPELLKSPSPKPQWLIFRLATTSGPSVLPLCPQRAPRTPSSSPDLHTEPAWPQQPQGQPTRCQQGRGQSSHRGKLAPRWQLPLVQHPPSCWSVGSQAGRQAGASDGHAREAASLQSRGSRPGAGLQMLPVRAAEGNPSS